MALYLQALFKTEAKGNSEMAWYGVERILKINKDYTIVYIGRMRRLFESKRNIL